MPPIHTGLPAGRALLRTAHLCTLIAVALLLSFALFSALLSPLPGRAAGPAASPDARTQPDSRGAAAAALAAAVMLTVEAESGVVSGSVVLGFDEDGTGYAEFGAAMTGTQPFTATPPLTDTPPLTPTPQPGFSFGTAGDLNDGARAKISLDALARSATDFYLALGDLSYSSSRPESAWCDFVQESVGVTYPFQLLVGNHEDEPRGDDGFIDDYAACLPDRLNVVGHYAHRYSFDYPPAAPLARFILIDPDLKRDGQRVQYCTDGDTENCAWLQARVDEARALGLWTIVGYHKNCHTIGEKPCEVGEALVDLLVERKVDLILMGHDHGYQRSKQVALGPACTYLPAGGFDPDCVVDDGGDGLYTRGAGTVWAISAAFGVGANSVNLSDPEVGYLAAWMDRSASSSGFLRFTVTPTRLDAQFVAARGSYTDGFAIVAPNDPGCTVDLSAAPGVLALSADVPAPGSYSIWSRQWISGTGGADLWVQVDDGCPLRLAPAQAAPGAWQWVNTPDGDPARRFTHQFLAGSHTIRLAGAAGLRLDRLVLTTDPTCHPAENCTSGLSPPAADVFVPIVTKE